MDNKEKRFVALSNKSLSKVWDWCEANEKHYLSINYMAVCSVLGVFDIQDDFRIYFDHESNELSKKTTLLMLQAYEHKNAFYKFRDNIGRLILKEIKNAN